MSSMLADQLKVKKKILGAPLGLQLAVHGSQSKINTTTKAWFQNQSIDLTCYFDIINLNSYDIILGTLWLYQHRMCIASALTVFGVFGCLWEHLAGFKNLEKC